MRTLLLGGLLTVALAPAAMAQTTPYATAPAISGVAAAGGWTAWSAQGPAGWQLTLRAPDGTITTPAVAARKIPFDAALGTGAGGAITLAYSACTTDPSYSTGGVDLAWYTA